MNSAEMYLKISKNILESISSFEKNELNKFEFNNNLFVNLSFLTKFASGKNIQDNPAFSFFIPKKSLLLNKQIAKNLQKENINFEQFNEEENLQTDNQIDTQNNANKKDNFDLDQTNIENITGKIEDDICLETRNSISIFNDNLDETLNLNKTSNNIMRDLNDFDAKNKLLQQNNKNMTGFDLEQSYVEDMSTIYLNDNFSEFNRDQSVFDPNLSVIMKRPLTENSKNGGYAYVNSNENYNKNKSQYNTIIKNSDLFNNMDYYSSSEYIKKKKAKFEEINGEILDSNISEEEFNYLIQKTNLEYVSKMFEKYTFLREEANPLMSTNSSFSSSRINETADISLFCKKFSAMLLEIGCDKYLYDECLQQCRYRNKKFKFYDFVSFFDQLLEKKYENNIRKYKFLLYISKKNNLDHLEDLSSFFELMKANIIYEPDLYDFIKKKITDRYKLFFPKDKVLYVSKLSFLLETFFRIEE